MGITRHVVTVYHYYQDSHDPKEQTIRLQCDYATARAFFGVLIDSQHDFDVELGTGKKEQKGTEA